MERHGREVSSIILCFIIVLLASVSVLAVLTNRTGATKNCDDISCTKNGAPAIRRNFDLELGFDIDFMLLFWPSPNLLICLLSCLPCSLVYWPVGAIAREGRQTALQAWQTSPCSCCNIFAASLGFAHRHDESRAPKPATRHGKDRP